MKLKELVDIINNSNIDITREITIKVVVHAPGSLGGTPSVDVNNVSFGFDWDNNKLLIYPEGQLTKLTSEQVAEISKSVSQGSSWHAYQNYKTQKAEIDVHKKEIKDLKDFIEGIDFNTLTIEQREMYKEIIKQKI